MTMKERRTNENKYVLKNVCILMLLLLILAVIFYKLLSSLDVLYVSGRY